ncbi:MAG: M20/M25/M40 family metallo-hydrolase [Candidatus Aureabacteria bacterium]|nr:M20/M25/M40 family metallo-hydrolase [Candidatus Auribacterota bacterium]
MEQITRYIEAHKEEFIQELASLCRIPSVSGNEKALGEAAAKVEQSLSSLGAATEVFEAPGRAPLVYAEMGDGPRTLLVYNHYDVQPPDPIELWSSDPFSPTIVNGVFYARGASDNKGNLMARIHAVRSLIQSGGKLPLRIKFLVEGEEETHSRHLSTFVREHPETLKADGCLWECSWKDPHDRPILTCGLKGLCYVELRAKGASHDLHSSYASIVPNPAWRLVWALSTLLDTDYRITLRNWMKEAKPLSDADKRTIGKIDFDGDALKQMYGLRGFIRDMSGSELIREYLCAPTCTICGLKAGYSGDGAKTVLPAEASAKLDFRLVPDMTPEKLLHALRRHLDENGFSDIELNELGGVMPAKTDCEDAIVKAAVAAARWACGKEPIVYPVAPWSGPLHTLCGTLGIPSVAFGIGNAGSRDHAPDENIRMSDYYEGIRFMIAFMRCYSTI